jgi:hypothetical protein
MTMAMLTVVCLPAVMHAQSTMRVSIAFDFYIGAQKFPSGNYIVEVSSKYLKVSDWEGHAAFALTNAVANPESRTLSVAKLLFTRYDNFYFLSEVRRAGYSNGNGLIPSHLESQIAKNGVERQLLAFSVTH